MFLATKCCILRIFERARQITLRKPKGELAPLARLKITDPLSEGDRIGVEILSDPTSIIWLTFTPFKS